MKAILIDVHSQTIKEVEVTKDSKGSNLQSMYDHIGCDCVTCVGIDDNNDVWVDDEGLLSLTPLTKFFLYNGYPQPLAGNGLITGIDNETGKSIDTTLSIHDVAKKVMFMNLHEVQIYAEVNNI